MAMSFFQIATSQLIEGSQLQQLSSNTSPLLGETLAIIGSLYFQGVLLSGRAHLGVKRLYLETRIPKPHLASLVDDHPSTSGSLVRTKHCSVA